MKVLILIFLLLCTWHAIAQEPEQQPTETAADNQADISAPDGAEDDAEEENDAAASGEKSQPDIDFTPDEEISEDFPVSLPSDI